MATLVAFYDANVLYPAELRNLLMRLAMTGSFRAKWSADVHEEWISNLLKNRPDLTRKQLERTRALMDKHAIAALVAGYKDLIPGLQLPDPDDRHVLAAAIRGGADVIVTMNGRDFPEESIGRFGIEAQHPDDFIHSLFGVSLSDVLLAARPIATVSRTHRSARSNTLALWRDRDYGERGLRFAII